MVELPRVHNNPVLSPFSRLVVDDHGRDGRGSAGSLWSIGSAGSILSIGSSGSILSIGSTGSVLSVGSAASVASVLSFLSVGSIASALSVGAVGGWRKRPGRVIEAGATMVALAALATGVMTEAVGRPAGRHASTRR